jgi:histidinol-phosphatase
MRPSSSQAGLLAWVERAVRGCRPIALRHFQSSSLRIERKADHSPVTIADRAIEARLRAQLARAFPSDQILGEEFGGSAAASGTYWTIDPIDGTRAFSRGLPSWGMLVGRVDHGRATLGVCDFPALDVTLAVAPGIAAYERSRGRTQLLPRPRPIRSLDETVIFHGGARWWQPSPYARGFARLIRSCYLERAYGDCVGFLWALRGRADAVIEYGVKPWDLVPFAALARATGRVLTDFSDRGNFSGPEVVMAHPAMARLVSRILRSRSP